MNGWRRPLGAAANNPGGRGAADWEGVLKPSSGLVPYVGAHRDYSVNFDGFVAHAHAKPLRSSRMTPPWAAP